MFRHFFFVSLCFFLVNFSLFSSSSDELSIEAINSRSGILYAGIDNALQIDGGYGAEGWRMETDNGIMVEDQDAFFIIPRKSGEATISLYCHAYLEKKETLRVMAFPSSRLVVNGVVLNQHEAIPKSMLIGSDSLGLDVFFTDDIIGIESWYDVVSFTIGFVYGSHYMSERSQGNRLNNRCKELLGRVPPNTEVVIRMILESNGIISETRPIYRITLY